MNNRLDKNQINERIYKVFSWVLVLILAFLFNILFSEPVFGLHHIVYQPNGGTAVTLLYLSEDRCCSFI